MEQAKMTSLTLVFPRFCPKLVLLSLASLKNAGSFLDAIDDDVTPIEYSLTLRATLPLGAAGTGSFSFSEGEPWMLPLPPTATILVLLW